MPFVRMPSRITARIVPAIVPLPPFSAAPPSAAAVIDSSSSPSRARDGLTRSRARGDQDAGDRGDGAGHDVDADDVPVDVDAGEAGGDVVAADGVDVAADVGSAARRGASTATSTSTRMSIGTPAIEPRARNTKNPSAAGVALRTAVGDELGDALVRGEGRQGRDHGVHPAEDDDAAVDQAAQTPIAIAPATPSAGAGDR